eukprot:6134223-Pyramimonas_sp.AAC.1
MSSFEACHAPRHPPPCHYPRPPLPICILLRRTRGYSRNGPMMERRGDAGGAGVTMGERSPMHVFSHRVGEGPRASPHA